MESRGPGEQSQYSRHEIQEKYIQRWFKAFKEKSRALFESKEIDRSDLILPNCLAVKFTYFNKIGKFEIFPDNISKSVKRKI